MRIGVDARELSGQPTGVGRYLGGLLREWTANSASHAHDFVIYAHRPVDASTAPVRLLPGSGGTLWEQSTLATALNRDRVEVLFSPAYSTPLLTRVPRIVAIHDISFDAHPEWYGWREGFRRRMLARQSAGAARGIVTISEFSKSEIVTRFGTDPSRISVIPPGIDRPDIEGAAQVATKGIPVAEPARQTSILYVGSIFNRRHVPDVIVAFSQVAASHPDAVLHLVGDNRSHPHQDIGRLIAASSAAERIHWHRYASERRLQELYRDARAFVFLSEYEGLGLPPLEALSVGVPSLLLDTPVARASCDAAAAYVPVLDPPTVASALERLLYDDAFRQALLAAAPATLNRYNWRIAAHDTLRVLENAR